MAIKETQSRWKAEKILATYQFDTWEEYEAFGLLLSKIDKALKEMPE